MNLFLIQFLLLLILHFYLNPYNSFLSTQNYIENVWLFLTLEI